MSTVSPARGFDPITKQWVFGHHILTPTPLFKAPIDAIARIIDDNLVITLIEQGTLGHYVRKNTQIGEPIYTDDIVQHECIGEYGECTLTGRVYFNGLLTVPFDEKAVHNIVLLGNMLETPELVG
jgi:hypothetical protein